MKKGYHVNHNMTMNQVSSGEERENISDDDSARTIRDQYLYLEDDNQSKHRRFYSTFRTLFASFRRRNES